MRRRNITSTLNDTCPIEERIRYWMCSPAIRLNPDAPLSEALFLMREHDVRRLPVVRDDGELCGIITQGDIRGADLLRAAGVDALTITKALQHVRVCEVMSARPVVVTSETSLREAALLMLEDKIGGLPVVDSDQRVVGIITESDIFRAFVDMFGTLERSLSLQR